MESEDQTSEGERTERAVALYLTLLRDALLDWHYLEHELRIEHLLESTRSGQPPDLRKLANPARHLNNPLRRLKQHREAGGADGLAYSPLGRARLDHLISCMNAIREDGVEGDLVDVGTGNGGAAILMRGYLAAHELSGPRVWAADRFDGAADLYSVQEGFARFDLLDERVAFLEGDPVRRLAGAQLENIALLRIGSRDATEVRDILGAIYDRVAPGGFVVVDDVEALPGENGSRSRSSAWTGPAEPGASRPGRGRWRRALRGRRPRRRTSR